MTKAVMTRPQRISVDLSDGEIAGLHWPGEGKPPLLFCHATGFCASAYTQMLSHLSARFEIFALDMRGHGRSALPADPTQLRSWRIYARDIGAFLDCERRERWLLAGHSMGGVTAALAAEGRGDVAALALIEPVAMPSLLAMVAATPAWPLISARWPLVRQAARRRSRWAERGAVSRSYAKKALFRNWAPGVLEDYLEDALAEMEDGGVRLSCEPAWEAATFAAHDNDFWGAIKHLPCPIAVYAADSATSTVRPFALRRLRRAGARVTVAAGVSHLAPLEKPAELAAYMAETLTAQ